MNLQYDMSRIYCRYQPVKRDSGKQIQITKRRYMTFFPVKIWWFKARQNTYKFYINSTINQCRRRKLRMGPTPMLFIQKSLVLFFMLFSQENVLSLPDILLIKFKGERESHIIFYSRFKSTIPTSFQNPLLPHLCSQFPNHDVCKCLILLVL